MVASFAIIHRSGYYTSQASGYYRADAEHGGVWLRGNERLGVKQGTAVQPLDFDLLCEGCDTAGKKLVKTPPFKKRALGVDITLSSPKAVSVLYAISNPPLRESIASAERAAVEATLRLIEAEIPLARRGHNGIRREHAKSFAAAVFTHSEARPEIHADGTVLASVQRHHHVCIPSIVERLDGTFGAVDTAGPIRAAKKLLGAAFRLQLATELEQRGFAIERNEDDWRWSIAGVPESVCAFFSARRSAIEAELAKAGPVSSEAPALAAAITRSTRRAKENVEEADRFARWRAAVEQLGFDPDAIVAASREAGRKMAAARSVERIDAVIHDRMFELPETLTTNEATFERRHLLEAACNALVGTGASVERAIQESGSLLDTRAVIELGTTRDGVVLSTPEMVAIERRMVETAIDLVRTHVRAPDPNHVLDLCRHSGLSDEQTSAACAATSGARLTNILAPAGTGKTFLLRCVAEAWASAGYEVVGTSVAWKAANTLRDDLMIPARAVDSLLARADAGQPVFAGRTVCIVDEAAVQSSKQLGRLVDHIACGGPSNILVMVGDLDQQKPIGPGEALRLLRGAIGSVALTKVYRQREAWAREAPKNFARGDAATALAAFDERGLVDLQADIKAAVEALADDWQAFRRHSPNSEAIILTKTNAEARAVTGVLRERLKREDVIGPREVLLPAVDASGNRYMLPVAAGDHLVSLCRIEHLGVVNGTSLIVERVTVARVAKTITITARRGNEVIRFSPNEFDNGKGRVRLANGLVSTLFRAQGATVDEAFVLLNDRFDRHDAYVASSRSRGDTRLYVSRAGLDAALRAESDDASPAIDDARRLAYLAGRLARERIKTTTLDLIDVAAFAERHIQRQQSRHRKLSHEL